MHKSTILASIVGTAAIVAIALASAEYNPKQGENQ